MSRKNRAEKRVIQPDPVYGSRLVAKFINRMMVGGKKVTAEKIFYKALDVLAEKSETPALEAFEKAISNVIPALEVRPRRVGGQTYQVPMEVRPDRKNTLALRWVVGNSRKRSGKSMEEKLSGELLDAFNGTGPSVKKREETHRMAEANKAFAHYRF